MPARSTARIAFSDLRPDRVPTPSPVTFHPVDFLWQHATHVMRPEMQARELSRTASPGDVCSCCERPSDQWIEPLAHAETRYGIDEVTCPGCQSLYHPSFNLLGVMQVRAGREMPMSLGMLTQGAFIVRSNQRPVFIGPAGWVNKFQTDHPRFFDVIEGGGARKVAAILTVLKETKFPALIIDEFDKQKPPLVENLYLSHSANRTVWASVKGRREIDLDQLRSLAIRVAALQLDSSTHKKWRSFMFAISSGNIAPDDAKLFSFLDQHPELIPISQQLPIDPYRRKAAIDLLRILHEDDK